jgi:hypothetical protein
MDDTQIRTPSTYPRTLLRHGTDWSAIWGGVFVFAAIWTVFETLALAIFSGVGKTASLQSSMGAGMAIWTVVLTIIAMYVAGRETGRVAGAITRQSGLAHGMMMFGLSVVGAMVLAMLAAAVLAVGKTATVAPNSGYLISAGTEWTAFITLLLGWLAALGGASSGAKQDVAQSRQPVQMQPAA